MYTRREVVDLLFQPAVCCTAEREKAVNLSSLIFNHHNTKTISQPTTILHIFSKLVQTHEPVFYTKSHFLQFFRFFSTKISTRLGLVKMYKNWDDTFPIPVTLVSVLDLVTVWDLLSDDEGEPFPPLANILQPSHMALLRPPTTLREPFPLRKRAKKRELSQRAERGRCGWTKA